MTAPILTREKLANAMIIASPKRDRPTSTACAVAYAPPRGPREILADDLENAQAARRWLDYQRRTVDDGWDHSERNIDDVDE